MYNKGASPVFTSDKLKIPIYAIALGDTTVKKDVILTKVEHNRLAYLGNDFPMEVVVTAKQLKGKTSTLPFQKTIQPYLHNRLILILTPIPLPFLFCCKQKK